MNPHEFLTGPFQRVQLIREESAITLMFRCAGDVWGYEPLRDLLRHADREHFFSLALDNKHKLIAVELVSIGSMTTAIVHPREVYTGLLLSKACAWIAVHNHPSGDPTPSAEDISLTRRLREAADMLGIPFLDHLIFGGDRYVSFVDDGYW